MAAFLLGVVVGVLLGLALGLAVGRRTTRAAGGFTMRRPGEPPTDP